MLPKGKGVRVCRSLCSGVLRANHPISMPKHTADKPTVLQSSKSEFPSLAKAADPGQLCPSVVTDTLMIIPRRQVWGESCPSRHVYVRVPLPGLRHSPLRCLYTHTLPHSPLTGTNFRPDVTTHSSTAEIEQNTKTSVWVTCLWAWCLA